MISAADPEFPRATPRAELLRRLRERLERAESTSAEMQQGLARADVDTIEDATARLTTLALEFKLLAAEYGRLPDEAASDPTAEIEHERRQFERTATRMARSAAISGGLLERMVTMSRRLLSTLQTASGEGYGASGRVRELPVRGLRLREEA